MLKIRFKEDYRNIPANGKIEFKVGVNLVVGDQGSGKSSLLESLITSRIEIISEDENKQKLRTFKTYFFDFEKDNLRTKQEIGEHAWAQIYCNFHSHGESVWGMLENIRGVENSFVIADEPDMALSIRSIRKLVKFLEELGQSNIIIASAHNPFLIESQEFVYNMEIFDWQKSKEFINSHLTD